MKVIIIGCGIAGPILAMLLKHKGFDVEIFERSRTGNTGVALVIAPQTFKVLDILGLADEVLKISAPVDQLFFTSQLTGTILMQTDIPSEVRQETGWPLAGIVRHTYRTFLQEAATARGIPIHFDKKASSVKQRGERVEVHFEDGCSVEGDLVVGCDGLHSVVREAIFGREKADFCGMVQYGGISNIPSSSDCLPLCPPATMAQVFGNGAHFVTYPVNKNQRAWFAARPVDEEVKESWQMLTDDKLKEEVRKLPQRQWLSGPQEIIDNSIGLVKYGNYDRPEMQGWHKGRVVLCGDAAHPTTPHLGQGANQATEDCYQLVRVLVQHRSLDSTSLEVALKEYEALRRGSASALVKQARREGELRVTQGDEECRKRDALLGQGASRDAIQMMRKAMLYGPFQGQSEI